jgi:hypothetical protein
MPAGRFVGARFFSERKNVPTWNGDLAPRFAAAYDLFGDGRTALKAAWSKYYEPLTGGFADTYAPGVQNEDRNWLDCDFTPGTSTCSGRQIATNNDGIAQDNEIGPSGNPNFGQNADRDFDPNIKRQSNIETMASVSHQLTSRLSMTFGYYHRTFQNLRATDRTLITESDYTAFTTPIPAMASPVNGGIDTTLNGIVNSGELLTIYNLNTAKRSAFSVAQIDRNVNDQSIYNGIDVSVQGRLPRGSTVIASWTMEKNVSVFCDSNDNPNGPAVNDLYTGASVSRGGRFCDQRKFDMPFTHEFKAAGNYPFPLGVEAGAVLQSYAGSARFVTWAPAASVFPGASRTNTETIVMNAPGSLYYPRYTQLDVNLKKNFRAGRKSFSGQIDVFNALNGSATFSRNNSVPASVGATSSLGQVESILQGRVFRLAFQMRF